MGVRRCGIHVPEIATPEVQFPEITTGLSGSSRVDSQLHVSN